MASWVLSIDAAHPHHWDYAQQAGFWDLRTKRNIEAGDLVYFWQSGKSFAGRVRATTDVYDLQPGMAPGPWDDWPGPYRARFEFEVVDPTAVGEPRWGEVQAQVSVKQGPNWAPRYNSVEDEAVVASYFTSPVPSDSPMVGRVKDMLTDAGVDPAEIDLRALTEDQRDLVEKFVHLRKGQQDFRKKLLKAYAGTCAVSGTSVEQTLDAAHISDYKGLQTQLVPNGLLLRTDLHRLFDDKKITVTADDYRLRVHPGLLDTTYGEFERQPITVPRASGDQPNRDLLAAHNRECKWLTT